MSAGLSLQSKAITKQINSPYAKYNSRGKLMCVVCGTEVKSAIIWNAHINKKSHLENLARLKDKQNKLNSVNKQALSSKGNATSSSNKRSLEYPAQTSKKAKLIPVAPKPSKGILKKLTTYSSEDSDEDLKPSLATNSNNLNNSSVDNTNIKTENGLPDNFFDNEEVKVKTKNSAEPWKKEPSPEPVQPPKPNTSEVLPEGFFDDPVADAKARKVEYKDKEAEEWMSFMKEVSAAELESRQIIAEDKEEAALESQIEEASEQLNQLQKVVDLDNKKKNVLQDKGNSQEESEESSSDEEFSPVIWRTKNSFI